MYLSLCLFVWLLCENIKQQQQQQKPTFISVLKNRLRVIGLDGEGVSGDRESLHNAHLCFCKIIVIYS